MKRILFVLSMIISVAYGQSVGQIRYDTTKFLKVGGYNEVKIQNSTKDSVGGLFTNVGNGWGKWMPPRSSGDTLFIGLDTVLVGSSITASNGLTKSGNDIQLGGTLGSATTITGVSNSLTFTGLSSFNISSTPLITTVTSSNTSMTARQALTNDGGRLFLQTSGAFLGYDTSAGGFHNYLEIDPVWFHIHMDSQDDSLKIDNLHLKPTGWDTADYKLMVNSVNIGAQFGGHTARVNWSDVATKLGGNFWSLASGGTLTGNNTIDLNSLFFRVQKGGSDFLNLSQTNWQIGDQVDGTYIGAENTADLEIRANGFLYFLNLSNLTTQDRLIGQRAANSSIGYVTIGTGLSLSSGVLSSTGSGITVGTTTITSGTDTRVPFNDAGVYNEDAGLVYAKATDKLTVGSTIGIEPASGTATLSLKSSAGAFTSTLVYDASRNCIWDYRDGAIIRVNGNNVGSWISTGLSVNGGGGTAADFTVRSTTYNPFFLVDVSADKISVAAGSTPTHTLTINGQVKVWAPQAGDDVVDSLAGWKDGVLSAITTVVSSTATPTLTGVINVASTGGTVMHYTRVGNEVYFSVIISVTPTAGTTATEVDFSLPFASNFTASTDLVATVTVDNGTYVAGKGSADATNDRGAAQFVSIGTTAHSVYVTGHYTIK